MASVVIKKEKIDEPRPGSSANDDGQTEAEIEAHMLELIAEHPKGMGNKMLATLMPNVDNKIRASILNRLLSQV